MKGLFQCPPRASPWVMMNASLSPCKGKSFQVPGNMQSFCPFRAHCQLAVYPGRCPGLGASALSGRAASQKLNIYNIPLKHLVLRIKSIIFAKHNNCIF